MRWGVVALVAVLMAACGSVPPSPTPTPVESGPSGSATFPPPSSTPGPTLGAWTHVTLTSVPSDVFGATRDDLIAAGTVWPGGFLFIGETNTSGTPSQVIWQSRDGSAWTRTVIAAFEGTEVRGIVWTGQRLLVIAVQHPPPSTTSLSPPVGFAWASSDAATWTPVADPDGSLAETLPVSIGSGPSGVVIAGGRVDNGISLLHSSDGLAWAADDTTTAVFSGVHGVGSVVGWPGGFLLAASVPTVITPPALGWAPPNAAAFGSGDGIHWDRGSVPSGAESLSFVTAGNNVVAVGNTCVACVGASASWSTTDQGSTWQLEPESYQGFPSLGTMITSTGTRFMDISAGRLRWSVDGRAWHILAATGAVISPDYFFDLLADGNRVVLLGWQGNFPPAQSTPTPTPLILVGQLR